MVKSDLPNLKYEKKYWADGFDLVGGIDEAGRGAWAGPVVVSVVIFSKNHRRITGINDSKLLTPKRREDLYEKITERALDFGIGIVGPQVIDEVNILNATKIAAREAMEMLSAKPDFLLTDYLDLKNHLKTDHLPIIGGDRKVYTISCASIIAKVTRDNIMSSLGGDYNRYEFHKHKGYGTKRHTELLDIFGPCDIHRKGYKPIKDRL